MNNKRVGIIGAGIQGICNALFLQKKGFEVVIFDKEERKLGFLWKCWSFSLTLQFHLIDLIS